MRNGFQSGFRFGRLGLAPMLAVGVAFASAAGPAPTEDQTAEVDGFEGQWEIRATGARIIGGYGQNFAYDGANVRDLAGFAEASVNTETGMGEVTIEVRTTPESGPIRFSNGQSFEGTIRIVQRLNTQQMEQARVVEEAWLHGDTGNEAPVMPNIFNYFATWGPASITVDGEEVVPMIGSHTMFSEQARGPDGQIAKGGQVYSPMVTDKTGFTNPRETEFHFVAHTTEPDENNFPPHTGWIHLHFSDVQVLEKPADVTIPYQSANDG